jgi:meiotically up-regulated gene 157 (Mug157) protein
MGELESALEVNAKINHPEMGLILAYEIDGFGSCLLEDEPNIPNLLSLPYLKCLDMADPLYQNTRKFILSENNPYFIKGKNAEGYSSPHISNNYIWHLSIIMRALTSRNNEEIKSCLSMIKSTHAGTGFMHEGFDRNNPQKYTRSWFSWANSLFGELVVKLWHENPDLLGV